MSDNITLPREVVDQLLKMLEMVEPYADQFTDYSSTAAEWPLNLLPKKVSEAITALRTHLAAEQPVAKAWAEGYQQGVKDERTSEASIGIAGFGAKVEPARQNPYGTALAAEQPKQEPKVTLNPDAMRTVSSGDAAFRAHLAAAQAAMRLEVTADPRLTPEQAAAILLALAAEQPKPVVIAKDWLKMTLRVNRGDRVLKVERWLHLSEIKQSHFSLVQETADSAWQELNAAMQEDKT